MTETTRLNHIKSFFITFFILFIYLFFNNFTIIFFTVSKVFRRVKFIFRSFCMQKTRRKLHQICLLFNAEVPREAYKKPNK